MKNFFLLLFLILISSLTQARTIQIIHTNDLHSFFEGTRDGLGGYARLKTVAEELRKKAADKNIPTLFLNAGDSSEGSSFYFADKGVDSLRALDLLGVDASVMGNHDFIQGAKDLRRQLLEANLKTHFLSANLKRKKFLGLDDLIHDHVDYDFDGLKVRVTGITTSELIYQYPLRPMSYLENSHKTGIKEAAKAEHDGIDFLIALTHIGLEKDIWLARKTHSIDLIVGGHSHDLLLTPKMVTNLSGKGIGIVQAGAHSNYLGKILIDIRPDKKSEILDYQMIEISPELREDAQVKSFVDRAREKREEYFQRDWNEIIGYSDIALSGASGAKRDKRTCWSEHLARLTRVTTGSDFGMQFDLFQGERIPPGPISYGDMVDNFPHFRSWGDKGWKMARARVSGFLLKKILSIISHTELSELMTIDGIKGRTIHNLRYYTIGLPSEIPYAMLKMFNVLGLVVLNDLVIIEGSDFWPLMEDYIRKTSPINCLED